MGIDLKFKQSLTCRIRGPSGSGKSSSCVRFLQNLGAMCTERDIDYGVISQYSEKTAFSSPTVLLKRDVHFNKGVATDLEMLAANRAT